MIARHGSLTKAAAALGISQPALSSGIGSLERDIGFKIFNRRTNPVTFTPEGHLYYEYLNRVKTLTEDFTARVESLRDAARRHAVIGAPVAYAETLVTDAIVKLCATHPEYSFAVKSAPLGELIEMASKGEINCFVSTTDELPGNFTVRHVMSEKIFLCVPAALDVNEKLGEALDYSVLDGENFIFLEEGQPLRAQTDAFLAAYRITPRCSVTVNQVSTALGFALKGQGICLASEEALRGNVDTSSICIYSLPDTVSGRDIFVAYDSELFIPEAGDELITLLENHL